jgi:drug/metabolite transporter (DMT)-like permease
MRLLHELRRLLLKTPNDAKKLGPHRLKYIALAGVCILWGTTYLGIRISLESLPPFYLIAIRYTISGAILLTACKLAGAAMPSGRELLLTGAYGAICIGIGNGFLAIAELWIPSGLAALFYTTAPFWMVGIDALLPGGRKPRPSTLAGLVIGLTGVVFLVLPAARHEGIRGATFTGFLVLQLSAAGWVLGSLLQKRVPTRSLAVVTGAVQQLAAGLVMFVPAAIFERAPHAVSTRSVLAVAYLVVFGSLIGYTAFIYSMSRLPVALVSVYTFVNPLVAVFLGWLFFREPFGWREFAAMCIIFAGVFAVKLSESAKSAERAKPEHAGVSVS